MTGAALCALVAAAAFPPWAAAAESSSALDFAAQLEEAERLRARAAEAGFEWLKTAELLQEARRQHEAGEALQARQLLEQGRTQAEQALRQAEHEAGAWRKRVVR